MLLLILSIPALFVGPLLSGFLGRNDRIRDFVDGFILVSIGGLVLFHILPDSIRECGWPAFAACAGGMLLPLVFHYAGPREDNTRMDNPVFAPVLLTALAGVAVHAFLDGMALVRVQGEGDLLAVAVVLHRFSVGLTIWWILRPAFGNAAAITTLVLIAILTPVGYFLGYRMYNPTWFALFQAFMAGSLLHVIYRSTPRQNKGGPDFEPATEAEHGAPQSGRGAALLGALAGLGSVVLLDFLQAGSPSHMAGHASGHGADAVFLEHFLDLLFAAAPPALGFSLVAAMIHPFLGRGEKSEDKRNASNDPVSAPKTTSPRFWSRERVVACLRFGFIEIPARTYPWLLAAIFIVALIDLLPGMHIHALFSSSRGIPLLREPARIGAYLRLFSFMVVAGIFLVLLFRRGPRDFLDQITLSRKHG